MVMNISSDENGEISMLLIYYGNKKGELRTMKEKGEKENINDFRSVGRNGRLNYMNFELQKFTNLLKMIN